MSALGRRGAGTRALGGLLSLTLLMLLLLPLAALLLSSGPTELAAALRHPMFLPALSLSLRTTLLSLACIVLLGTPLAYFLALSRTYLARVASLLVDLPIVLPPAVVGLGLLLAFGRMGLLGETLASAGLVVPFTALAVVIAQVVVAAPFYVQAAASAFAAVEPDSLIVARTLGASPASAWLRVAVPAALPGLLSGAALAFARALGEFGATLLFAGNMSGTTQTLPLAIFAALETDLRVATVLSLVLAAAGAMLLAPLRFSDRIAAFLEGLR